MADLVVGPDDHDLIARPVLGVAMDFQGAPVGEREGRYHLRLLAVGVAADVHPGEVGLCPFELAEDAVRLKFEGRYNGYGKRASTAAAENIRLRALVVGLPWLSSELTGDSRSNPRRLVPSP